MLIAQHSFFTMLLTVPELTGYRFQGKDIPKTRNYGLYTKRWRPSVIHHRSGTVICQESERKRHEPFMNGSTTAPWADQTTTSGNRLVTFSATYSGFFPSALRQQDSQHYMVIHKSAESRLLRQSLFSVQELSQLKGLTGIEFHSSQKAEVVLVGWTGWRLG
ncbi:MAG TPA: hypothetical protein VLU25_04960 [Acidobacteriota bacterium]|nr:hypothetical protein [Acidobacteriota bacterium]